MRFFDGINAMNAKLSSLFEYLNWILQKYQEIQQQIHTTDTLRILDITRNKTGKNLLKIQIIGKASVFECTPEEIVSNDKLLEAFSKKDIRTITYFATQEIKKPKYKILLQEFREGINRMIFKIAAPNLAEPIEKTAEQISLDKNLINKLSAEDAHFVGFTTAAEQAIRDKEEMERLKHN